MGVIDVLHLTKDYGSGRGVFDISFSVEKGEVFGFLGPNGAGKSTTIRHIMAFSRPDAGETRLFGLETFKNYPKILSRVGYIPGEIALPQGLTGLEFLKMIQDLQKIHNNARLRELLRYFELDMVTLKGETKKMSLGVKRKLAIVSAFMGDPEVYILDEPTSGLDPVMQERFVALIKKEKERGKTILLSSHIFSEVDETCDRVAIIKDGKIVSEVLLSDLKHASQKVYHIIFKQKEDFQNFKSKTKKCEYIKIIEADEPSLDIKIMTNDKDINRVVKDLSNYELEEFSNIKETLEEYFMKYYKEDSSYYTIKKK